MRADGVRWSNVPVPVPHLAAAVAAAGLHWVVPLRIPLGRGTRLALAVPMCAAGVGLAAWAVGSAGDADIERDSALVARGAYAFTRNPMYLGWSIGMLGLAFGTGSAWLLAGCLAAASAIDREVDAEEARLRQRFGAAYVAYRDRVPRYFPALPHRSR
jgi:protein-S-isoprenylcysteine O-methyltransferase Ste14